MCSSMPCLSDMRKSLNVAFPYLFHLVYVWAQKGGEESATLKCRVLAGMISGENLAGLCLRSVFERVRMLKPALGV